jgi:MFS family permease
MNSAETVAAKSPWGALRHRDFRLFWAARTISAAGDRITLLALPSTAILVLGASAVQVGMLSAVGFLAWPALGLVVGVWVDRLRRRRILVVADLGRAVLIASIPISFALGHLGLAQLFVVAELVGVLAVFWDLAATAHTPVIVPAADWADANAKVEIAGQAVYSIGPGVAGALIALLTAPFALLADGASFLVSGLLIRLTGNPGGVLAPAGRRSLLREAGEGLRFIARRPVLLRIAVTAALSNIGLLMGLSVQLLFLYRVMHLSPLLVGFAFGVGSLGSLVGAAFTGRLIGRLGMHRTLVISTAIEGLSLLLIPLGLFGPIVPLLMLGLAASGFWGTIWNVSVTTFRQRIISAEILGRVSAAGRIIAFGALPLGSLLGGFVGQALSDRFGTSTGLALTLLIASLVAGASALSLLSSRGFSDDWQDRTPDPL